MSEAILGNQLHPIGAIFKTLGIPDGQRVVENFIRRKIIGEAIRFQFNDVFLIIAFMALAALLPSLFLRRPKARQAEQPAAAAATPAASRSRTIAICCWLRASAATSANN